MGTGTLETSSRQPEKKSGFFYGYVIVIVCFLMMVFGWGTFYVYGVFFTPLEQAFNWTRALTSGAYSLAVLFSGMAGIIAGRLSDRLGPKMVLIFCAVMLFLGYLLMSFVQNAWQFYLVYGLLVASGVGGFWAPPMALVARWFTGRRGLMSGIVSGGISFGTLILPPVLTQLITAFDWRVTYLVLSITVLIVFMISIRFLRNPPQPAAPAKERLQAVSSPVFSGFTLKEALHTRQFWLVAVIYVLFGLAQLTIIVHIVPDATSLNISDINAAAILSIIGGMSLAGRILIGMVADRARVKITTIVCLGLMLIGLVLLQFTRDLWQFYLFAVIFGFGYGGLSCLQSLIATEFFGLAAIGVITAIFSFSFDIGGAIGPVMAGYIFDVSRSYHWAFLVCLLVISGALLISVSLKPPRK